MKISVFGAGYVGLVTAACLAHEDNQVACLDIDSSRIAALNDGQVPIHEPGLEKLIQTGLAREQICFSLDPCSVATAELVIIAVGTPTNADGQVELTALFSACDSLAAFLTAHTLVVIKSTVPVGTTRRVKAHIQQLIHARGLDWSPKVAFVPEFLREGSAIKDFQHPDRIVAGVYSIEDAQFLKTVFKTFIRHDEQWVVMDPASAELTKYAANAMLAARISFMNEIANLAEALGADVKQVQRGMGSDRRIGAQFLNPGIGFGGSCFPKDLRAVLEMGEQNCLDLPMMNAIYTTNTRQADVAFDVVSEVCFGSFKGKTLAVWGLAFKGGSDDVRESASLKIVRRLLDEGATVLAYDEFAKKNVQTYFGETLQFILCDSPEACLHSCDGLLVLTEAERFAEFPVAEMAKYLKGSWVFDGRNILAAEEIVAHDIQYCAIGRVIETKIVEEAVLEIV